MWICSRSAATFPARTAVMWWGEGGRHPLGSVLHTSTASAGEAGGRTEVTLAWWMSFPSVAPVEQEHCLEQLHRRHRMSDTHTAAGSVIAGERSALSTWSYGRMLLRFARARSWAWIRVVVLTTLLRPTGGRKGAVAASCGSWAEFWRRCCSELGAAPLRTALRCFSRLWPVSVWQLSHSYLELHARTLTSLLRNGTVEPRDASHRRMRCPSAVSGRAASSAAPSVCSCLSSWSVKLDLL